MTSTSVVTVVVGVAVLTAISTLVLALWRHKRASAGDVKLFGEAGQTESRLDPEGSVIIRGELWRARSHDGAAIEANRRVRVVGVSGHLVLVELSDASTRERSGS